jgi:N-acetylneuraminic acid mutarotase
MDRFSPTISNFGSHGARLVHKTHPLLFGPLFLVLGVTGGGASEHNRTLTFEDRVGAQEAIERVDYSHQIGATRRFEEAVPREVIESKVRRSLKLSVALEAYWNAPVTAAMLDGETRRLAQRTRLPERLQEIYAALGNDSFLFEECYARQVLVERLAREFFSSDVRIHAEARREAATLHEQLLSGVLSAGALHPRRTVVTLRRRTESDLSSTEAPFTGGRAGARANRTLDLSSEDFHRLRSLSPAEAGAIGPVVDRSESFTISVVLGETGDNAEIAIFSIPKLSWSDWWGKTGARIDETTAHQVVHVGVVLPSLARRAALSCQDVWDNRSLDDLPDARSGHAAVWTGTEMIVWGGNDGGRSLNSGGRYDPTTDTWAPTSAANAPEVRQGDTVVWTGTEMIVWGGFGNAFLDSGGRYDPATDRWTSTSIANAPQAREYHTAVWTGTEMIVWGGYGMNGAPFLDSGGRYNPATDTWTSTTTAGAPMGRQYHTAVWTGSRMIVWGGYGDAFLDSGGRYDPATDTWAATSTTNAPEGRQSHAAVWTGARMIVWGGFGTFGSDFLASGGRYNPATDTWAPTTTSNAPEGRYFHTAVWTGTEMIVWGGASDSSGSLDSGGRYDPTTDTWRGTGNTDSPAGRGGHSAVWTGTEMIVWGGQGSDTWLDSGGRYSPATDAWAPTSALDAPEARSEHTAVWTGTEMIVWGGMGSNGWLASGGRYDPTADTWTPTSTANAPEARLYHTAVWTGVEMIVWGGQGSGGWPNSGGRYDPAIDTWTPTSTANAPEGRAFHTAVWTGTEMIVWGGFGADSSALFNSGGRYDPSADRWASTSTANVPAGRYSHSAVWSGTEMVVWGGFGTFGSEFLASGGRYDPATDTWVPTTTSNAPEGRYFHTAVWTGTEMIVWGGFGTFYGSEWLNSGGRYDPPTDSWLPTASSNAPEGRYFHTAVWTGTEMIVWGGVGSRALLDSGGRYDPALDTWESTTPSNSPEGRESHTAIWTGTGMIVWGGSGGLLRSGGVYEPIGVTDDDGDGIPDACDNCPTVPNPDQDPCACGPSCGASDVTISFDSPEGHGSGVVRWLVARESDVVGFNVVEIDSKGNRTQLNPALILCAECSTGLGHGYMAIIPKHKSGQDLFVEVVRLHGPVSMYGPAQRI